MFIFADLFAKYLEAQLSKAALLAELDPNKLPVSLDQLYVYSTLFFIIKF